MGGFAKLLWFGTRAGLAGGVVYFSVDQGIWRTHKETAAFTQKICKEYPQIKTWTREYVLDYFPKNEDVRVNFGYFWNKTVLWTFRAISNLPETAVKAKDYTVESVNSLMQYTESGEGAKS